MIGKTNADIEKVVLAAIDLLSIEQQLDKDPSSTEASITNSQDILIRRNNPLQEWIVEVKVR